MEANSGTLQPEDDVFLMCILVTFSYLMNKQLPYVIHIYNNIIIQYKELQTRILNNGQQKLCK